MAMQAGDMPDLIATTLRDLGRLKFNQIAQKVQHYNILGQMMMKQRVMFQSGHGIQKNLQLSYDEDAASFVGLLDADSSNITDSIVHLQVPWRHVRTNWSIIYTTDVLMNRGEALIVNVIKPKRSSSLISLAEKLESKFWGDPPSASNTVDPYGIQYWLVANGTAGFNGGAPSGHTTVGGVNPSTYDNFKNYTDRYVDVTKADLIRKMRVAHRLTNFVSPIDIPEYRGDIGKDYRCYTTNEVMTSIEDSGEGQNENLGRDIASMDGQVTFKRNPFIWVPKLDSRTDGPVYMINHQTLQMVGLKGAWLRESPATQNPNNHDIFTVYLDTTVNMCCDDRRANAVINTAG